jgi:hypothetical protein
MSSVAPNWKECSVQKLTGTQPRITPITVAVATKYTSQASSSVPPTASPWRMRATAPGMPMSAGTRPSTLTMAASTRVSNRSSAKARASSAVPAAPQRMARISRLRGLPAARAWPMNKKEPQVAIRADMPLACCSNQGRPPHRYCAPTPKKCSENSRLPEISKVY